MTSTRSAARATHLQSIADVPISWREKICYSLGEVANNLSWTMVGGFLLYYYTNVALLPVAALGTLLLVARGLDAFVDPVVGVIMDRTRTRFGRARPYVLLGALPMAVLEVMTFTSPVHGTVAKLVYAYATLLLVGVAYSVVFIPYGSLMPMITKDSRDKVQIASLRSIGTSVGAIAITSLMLPVASHLGQGNAQHGFTLAATVFAIVGTLLYVLVFFNTEERYVELMSQNPLSVKDSIREVMHNDVFVVSAAFAFVHLLRLGCILAVTVYFALLVLKAPWTVPFLFGAMSVGSILSASIATPYFQRFGFKKGNAYALAFAMLCYCILPFCTQHPPLFIGIYGIACVGAQACTTAIFAMIANASDYHEFKFHSRNDGLIFSGISLATKVGIALGGAVIAFGLAFVHYNAVRATPEAIAGIRWMYLGLPMVLMAIQIVISCFYRIDAQQTRISQQAAAS